MKLDHGFLEITYDGEDSPECADELCSSLIQPQEMCFIDTQSRGLVYCKYCGPCVRYHRKKAEQRGE